jgi:hypothetical protein
MLDFYAVSYKLYAAPVRSVKIYLRKRDHTGARVPGRTLMKLNQWVNFTNILLAAFTYISFMGSFFCAYILGLYFTGARLLAQKL